MDRNLDETVIGEVKIELDDLDFESNQAGSLTKYFEDIQKQAEKAGLTVGQAVEKMAESLRRISGRKNLSKELFRAYSGYAKPLADAGADDFLKWATSGEISAETFGEFGKGLVRPKLPGLDIKSLNTLLSRNMITEEEYGASDFFKKYLPTVSDDVLRKHYQSGDINRETFLNFADARVNDSNLSDGYKKLARINNRLTPSGKELAFKKNWDEAAMGVARFAASMYALEAPFRKFYHFIDSLKQANLQFANLAQSANTTAGALASQSGLAAASGSSAAAYANFRRSFEMEMEKRNVGMGNGGQFTQTLARYGISYDPSSFDATMRNIVAFMSDPSKNERQRQMAGQMLGMDQGMISAAMRGQSFYDQYTKETKSLTTNSDAAAAASRELALETQKLALAWQDFKNGIFAEIAPGIQWLVSVATQIVKIMKLPVIRELIGVTAALVTAVKTWALAKIAISAGKAALGDFIAMMVRMAGIKTAEKTIEAATSVAGATATAAGGIAGGIGKTAGSIGKTAEGAGKIAGKAGGLAMLGPWGAALAAVDVVSGVTNTIMGGIQRHNTNVKLDNILSLLTQRIPANFANAMGDVMIKSMSMRGFKGAGGGAGEIKIENINVKVEYLGESKDELVSEIGEEIEGNLKTSLKGLLT